MTATQTMTASLRRGLRSASRRYRLMRILRIAHNQLHDRLLHQRPATHSDRRIRKLTRLYLDAIEAEENSHPAPQP